MKISIGIRILERNVKIHRIFSDSFKAHFVRLWERPLLSEEGDIVDNAQLCFSFMRLESDERNLAVAKNSAKADEIYAEFKSGVATYSPEILAAFESFAKENLLDIIDIPDGNLLIMEEAGA